jgi:muconate cycloisomerase
MRVTRVEIDQVVVPARPDSVNSPELDKPLHMLPHAGKTPWSVQFDQIPKLLLRLHTDEGTVGLGECYRGVALTAVQEISRSLIGCDLAAANLQALPLPAGRLYDGFETAILDAVGRLRNMSIAEMLGGRYRERVSCGYWTGHRTTADAARKAAQGKVKGFNCIKFKCDSFDPVDDWCAAIREACGPQFRIILDPNGRFENVAVARGIARRLEAIGNVLLLEDPIPRWDVESLALLRKLTSIPIALQIAIPYNEMGYQHHTDILRALRTECCDYFNLNGGVFPVKRMAVFSEIACKPFFHGSEVDLGILEAAYLQKCAACESATLPSDIFGELVREDDLIVEPIRFEGGQAIVPAGPGLGVELDLDMLQRYCTGHWEVAA